MMRAQMFFWMMLVMPMVAQEATVAPGSGAAVEVKPELKDDGSRVTVLGYHDFSETQKETDMRIKTSKFRTQMQAIKDAGLPVISMADFLAWKKGEKKIPEKAVLLTFDDGWKSVYTDAYPILKEFRYPFTLFLYKNYVGSGGKSLSIGMLEEMIQGGASIGSHSVSHPYPQAVKAQKKKGDELMDEFLRKEMGESKRFLEDTLKVPVKTYCYPGGYHTPEMYGLAKEFGYEASFTVAGGKVTRDTQADVIPRYVVLGTHDSIFSMAMNFSDGSKPVVGASPGMVHHVALPYPVVPMPGTVVQTRMPDIAVDLSTLVDVDPSQLVMKVSGFGEVPAVYHADSKKFTWRVNRRLRHGNCEVSVTWKDKAGKECTTPLHWSFNIDQTSNYYSQEP